MHIAEYSFWDFKIRIQLMLFSPFCIGRFKLVGCSNCSRGGLGHSLCTNDLNINCINGLHPQTPGGCLFIYLSWYMPWKFLELADLASVPSVPYLRPVITVPLTKAKHGLQKRNKQLILNLHSLQTLFLSWAKCLYCFYSFFVIK